MIARSNVCSAMESTTWLSCFGVLLLPPPPPAVQHNRPLCCTPLPAGLAGPVCLLHCALWRLLCVRLQARVRRLLPAPAACTCCAFFVRTSFNCSLPCHLHAQSPAAVMSADPRFSHLFAASPKRRSCLPRSPCTLFRTSLPRSPCNAHPAPSPCSFKIKDFGDSIPGHGGVTDRFDCQVSGLLPLGCCGTRFTGRPVGRCRWAAAAPGSELSSEWKAEARSYASKRKDLLHLYCCTPCLAWHPTNASSPPMCGW